MHLETERETVLYSKQFDTVSVFLHVSYGGTHSANSQPFAVWDAEENRTDKGKERLEKD